MDRLHSFTLVTALSLLTAACSEHDDHDGADPHANHGSAGSAGASAGESSPTLTELMPMGGALHVMWTNPASGCDTIEGERKTPTEGYQVVFSVPGEADNKHDSSANQDVEYTYRLRCKKGDVFSPYSNELSRNPKK